MNVASLEDGDMLFASKLHSYEQVKRRYRTPGEQEWILRGSHSCRWLDTGLLRLSFDNFLGADLPWTSSSLPRTPWTQETDGELVDPYDKDFSGFVLKLKPTWILVTVTASLYPLVVVSGELSEWVSISLVLVSGAKLSNVTHLWPKVENVTNAGWRHTFMIQVPTRLEIRWLLAKQSLSLNHYQPSRLRLWRFHLRTCYETKILPQGNGTVILHPAL